MYDPEKFDFDNIDEINIDDINVDDIDIEEIDSFDFEDMDIETNENHSFYNKDRQNTIHTYKEMDYLENICIVYKVCELSDIDKIVKLIYEGKNIKLNIFSK